LARWKLLRLRGVGEEDRQAIDHQGARQAVDNRTEHLVEIGLGVQIAAELDQGAAVVIALAVEDLVEALLHPVLEWDRTATP
jgi:hypothetical protein